MGNKLVIVESPTKARSIGGMLGKNYTIMASMGHVRDLPENSIGVDVNNKFNPNYVVTKSKTVTELKKAASGANEIYLATDPDREGEAIAWHLKEVLSEKSKADFYRVEFHEITKNAIQRAFDNPRSIDDKLVDSQQARRILDRLVGYQVSPLLWSRIQRNISAGRVQSVALRMICEREREILAFEPKEYWNFGGDFLHKGDQSKKYSAKLLQVNNKKAEIPNQETAEKIFLDITNSKLCSISDAKQEIVNKRAPAPFITSTLQQAAGTSLRFSASRTMQIAQQLYEGIAIENEQTVGLITYMRTDSFTIAKEAVNKCRGFIEETFGEKYVPQKPNFFKNKSSAQEAHEAIRPTNLFKTPESLKDYLSKEQYNLYRLIWTRFVASQMSPAQVSKTTIDTKVDGTENNTYLFRTISSVTVFPGFEKVLRANKEDDSGPAFLTEIKKDDPSTLSNLTKEQKFTEPPPRFTEPSLIRELEANGIGRPSTYASIINTILKRRYTDKEKGKLKPTDLGFNVNDYLVEFLDVLFNIGFTAKMESKLDDVEEGKELWTDMLDEFYNQFIEWLDNAKYKDAPKTNKVTPLIDSFEKIIKWEEPVKSVGRGRARNDKTFVNSIRKQFEKNKKLSKKQWESLLVLALKYSDQISTLDEIAQKHNFTDEIVETKKAIIEREKINAKKQKENSGITENIVKAINLLSKDAIKEFSFNNSFRFSEETFFTSLIQRAEQKQPFSIKQQNVFCRIIIANKEKISNFDEVKEILGFSEDDFAAKNKPVDEEKSKEISDLLIKFDNFDNWGEPQKKGKRTFNDKDFYSSLKKQFEAKKQLSPKQIFALKKIITKYFEKK